MADPVKKNSLFNDINVHNAAGFLTDHLVHKKIKKN